jgi:hypothetical protein
VVDDAAPFPITFTARTCTPYVVPFVKPVTKIGLTTPPEVIQVDPLSSEYSTRVTGDPPFEPSVNPIEID